jgi:DNA-binding beta-propeller fold protein YncE
LKRAVAILTLLAVAVFPALPAGGRRIAGIGLYGNVKHFRRGDALNIYATGFFPRYLCSKKIKFRLKDSDGHKFKMKSIKPEAEGIFTARNSSPYVGNIPNEAALGKAKIRGKQKCGPILGSASDTDKLKIVQRGGRPDVNVATSVDVVAGLPTLLHLRFLMEKWTLTYLTVTVEYEVTPGVWRQVDTVTTTALLIEGQTIDLPWKAKLDEAAPAGRYRFHAVFTDEEYDGGIQEEAFAEFSVVSPLEGADSPLDGAVNSSDQLVIGDVGLDALLVYDRDGDLVDTYEGDGFDDPKDLDFGPDGKIYVADYGNQRIAVLSPTGTFLDERGEGASGPFGGRNSLNGIAVDSANSKIYVASQDARKVFVFPLDTDTTTPEEIVLPEFEDPIDVDVAADGSIYVADQYAEKVFHFTPEGTLIGELGGAFGGPVRSVSVAPDGRIYVVAGQYVPTPVGHYEHEVWIFEEDGTLVDRLGRALLRDTSGVIAAGAAGDVFVTEKSLGHVYRFRAP